jgi:hypothetical protein
MASKEHFIIVKHGFQPTWKSGKTWKKTFTFTNAQYKYMDRMIFSLTGMWVYVGSTSQDTVIVV